MYVEITKMGANAVQLTFADVQVLEVYDSYALGPKKMKVNNEQYMVLTGAPGNTVGCIHPAFPNHVVNKIFGKVGKLSIALQPRQLVSPKEG